MKTLEFKLMANNQAAALIDEWRDRLRSVWNSGLKLLEESQQRKWVEKHNRLLPPSLVLQYRRGKFTGSGIRKSREGYKCCPIRQCRDIEDPKKLFNSGSYYNNSNAPYLADIPSKFRTGVHKSLQEAWKRYQDPQHSARRPRYKGKKDTLRSLANYNAGGKSQELKPIAIVGTNNGYVQFPGLGKLHVKGLYSRFDPTKGYGCAKIVCEPSGYYLQVAVESEEKFLKPCDKAVGIDPGVAACITDDCGRQIRPANLLRKQLKRLRRLQRKASRQKKGSGEQKRTYQRVAKLHEKVRRSRSAFNHKLSSKLVAEYGAIAFEGSNLQNMTRRPKAKQREDGSGYEQNGAKRKAGLNRALTDVAWGDLRAKTEQKCKTAGREFEKTTAAYSSRKCHRCREEGDRRSQSEFVCINSSCTLHQLVQSADGNAAKNHLFNSGFLSQGKYRTWGWAEEMPPIHSASAEVAEVGTRELKRSKKHVTSRAAGTRPKGEKRSRKGKPSEATKSPQSNDGVAPAGETTCSTLNSSFPDCGNQGVYQTSNQQKQPQTFVEKPLQLPLPLDGVVATPENLSEPELQVPLMRKRKSKKLISGNEERRFSQSSTEKLTSPGSSGTAPETNPG